MNTQRKVQPRTKQAPPHRNPASATIDAGVDLPAKSLPENSKTSALLNLAPGESHSQARRLPMDAPYSEIRLAAHELRGMWHQPPARARQRCPEMQFTTSVIDGRSATGEVIVAIVITRIN